MSLYGRILAIRSMHDDARKRVVDTLGEEEISTIQSMNNVEDWKIRRELEDYFSQYPSHREIALGRGVGLEKRADELLQEEFGLRDKKGNLKRDREGNVLYERYIWKTKRFRNRISESPLANEILAVAGSGLEGIHFTKMGGSRINDLFYATGITGVLGAIIFSAAFLKTGNPEYLGVVFGGLGTGVGSVLIASTLPAKAIPVLKEYLEVARKADTFLQKDVSRYLSQEFPYR